MPATSDRYIVISADGHAGGSLDQYGEYLEAKWQDEYAEWRGRYKNPWRDLEDDRKTRNWDNERRLGETEADGIVAEVLFPNTIPPFFPTGEVIAPAARVDDYERRQAGTWAHNRWLADFVAAAPHRRAGQVSIPLANLDDAVTTVEWAVEHNMRGLLLPGVAPDTPWIEPLYSPTYDRLWAVVQESGLPLTHHGGGTGLPTYGRYPASSIMFVLEAGFFANRALWHLTMSGVLERFPDLKLVLTEQGVSWVPPTLARMDAIHSDIARGGMGELGMPEQAALAMRPSEYFARNVWVGASFPSPTEAAAILEVGVDRVMWGSDYPHSESTFPLSRESLRHSFSTWAPADLRQVLSENAAFVYGFDLDALAPIADTVGPTVDEIRAGIDEVPDHQSPAFRRG
jgi:predicted TIM-barrel fold metal-dependent hydrolase